MNRHSPIMVLVLAFLWNFVLFFSHTLADDIFVVAAGKRAKRTVLVSPKGTPAQSGTALLNALTGITDATADNPYLLLIEPGVYDLEDSTLQMKPHVDIQGSGEGVTTLSGNHLSGVVQGSSNAEIRFLTVKNEGEGTQSFAIYNSGESPRITHVTAMASGGTNFNAAVNNWNSSPTMLHVTAEASGGSNAFAVWNQSDSTPTMTHVSAMAFGASNNRGVRNADSSPIMIDVNATAQGDPDDGSDNRAVSNTNSSPQMTAGKAVAKGGEDCLAVYNSSGSMTLKNVFVKAEEGSETSTAIHNVSSSLNMEGISAEALGSAMVNEATGGTYTFHVDRCSLTGDKHCIVNDSEFTMNVGASMLDGSVGVSGTWNCTGCYKGDYTGLGTNCQ